MGEGLQQTGCDEEGRRIFPEIDLKHSRYTHKKGDPEET
jgi:hypothetical protein